MGPSQGSPTRGGTSIAVWAAPAISGMPFISVLGLGFRVSASVSGLGFSARV